jgi:hypothetical protein
MSITPFSFLFLFPYIISSYFSFSFFIFPFSFFLILFLFSSYLHRKAHARHRRGLIHSSCRGAQTRHVRECSSPHGPRLLHAALATAQHATSSSAPPALTLGTHDLPSPDYSTSTARAPSAGLLRLQLYCAAAVEPPTASPPPLAGLLCLHGAGAIRRTPAPPAQLRRCRRAPLRRCILQLERLLFRLLIILKLHLLLRRSLPGLLHRLLSTLLLCSFADLLLLLLSLLLLTLSCSTSI